MAEPVPDRRVPTRQRKIPHGRRETDQYWTVPEIATDLRRSERWVWRTFLRPRILSYYDFAGTIRVDAADYEAFKQRYFRPRLEDRR